MYSTRVLFELDHVLFVLAAQRPRELRMSSATRGKEQKKKMWARNGPFNCFSISILSLRTLLLRKQRVLCDEPFVLSTWYIFLRLDAFPLLFLGMLTVNRARCVALRYKDIRVH